MWKGGVLSVYNHNICVYNLTITSTCYGQHVECVRPEVQMVLFNTVSTVHVVNRTRVNSRSIIIATLDTLDMLSRNRNHLKKTVTEKVPLGRERKKCLSKTVR